MRSAAILVLLLCAAAATAASCFAGPVGSAVFVTATLAIPSALVALAAPRAAPRGRVAAAALGLALLLGGGAVAVLWLDPAAAGPAGLPAATWVMLGALGIAPLVFTSAWLAATLRRAEPR